MVRQVSVFLAAVLVGFLACMSLASANPGDCAFCDPDGFCYDIAGGVLGSCACVEADVATPLAAWCEAHSPTTEACNDSLNMCADGNAECCAWHEKACAEWGACGEVEAICIVCSWA